VLVPVHEHDFGTLPQQLKLTCSFRLTSIRTLEHTLARYLLHITTLRHSKILSLSGLNTASHSNLSEIANHESSSLYSQHRPSTTLVCDNICNIHADIELEIKKDTEVDQLAVLAIRVFVSCQILSAFSAEFRDERIKTIPNPCPRPTIYSRLRFTTILPFSPLNNHGVQLLPKSPPIRL
jgi:hypothetical protein